MLEQDRKNLELLYQIDIQVTLMWISAALVAVVTGFFAAYQFEGITRSIVSIGSLAVAVILMCPVIASVRRAKKIMKLLGIEKTITNYLDEKNKE